MAAPVTTGGSLNTITIATIRRYIKKFADNVTSGPGLMRYAKRHKLIRVEDLVGPESQIPIDRETNSNGQWFDGVDSMVLQPSSGMIDSYAGHYNYRSGFYIDDIERLENAGASKMFDLQEIRMMACERQMRVGLAQALVGTRGSDTTKPEGVRDLMGAGTPASITGSYQSLSASTYTWWKPNVNVVTSGLGANNSNIRVQAIHQWANLQVNLAQPKVGLCDQVYYEEFLKMTGGGAETPGYAASNVRTYGDTSVAVADGNRAVPDLKWRGVEVVFDTYNTVPSAYTSGTDAHVDWLDTDFYWLKVDGRLNFKVLMPRKRSGDDEQWVDRYQIGFRCSQQCLSRRAHGITVFDLPA